MIAERSRSQASLVPRSRLQAQNLSAESVHIHLTVTLPTAVARPAAATGATCPGASRPPAPAAVDCELSLDGAVTASLVFPVQWNAPGMQTVDAQAAMEPAIMCVGVPPDTSRMDELRRVLDDLDDWLRVERPDLYPRLRPGLSPERIRTLEARLAPYRLPEDLVVLYSWHDGWDAVVEGEYVGFLPDMPFNSLGEAVEQYTFWCSMIEQQEDIWNRLWFPAFGDQSGEFVELQRRPGQSAGLVWSFHSHDAWVSETYASVTALFETTLGLWRRGLMPFSGPYFPEGFHAFVAAQNPETRQPDGRPYRQTNSFPSLDEWPTTWLAAAGITVPAPADDAEVVTVAELLADPRCGRPVRGHYRCRAGSTEWETGILTDETGSVEVRLGRASTENYRLLHSSPRLEMTLTPIEEGETVDEALAAAGCKGPAEESVTRRILEATAASFHAHRVVPLPMSGHQDT